MSLEKIQPFLQPEFVQLVAAITFISWLVYKILLRHVSAERHRNLQGLFRNVFAHLFCGAVCFGGYSLFRGMASDHHSFERASMYLGFVSYFWGLTIIVKASRIVLFEYLFLSHMRAGVPVLIVNLFSFVFSLCLAFYVATDLFEIKVTPLLATSAVLSLVIGLALQDTLGNLFAGVSLQFDKPYSIDDWIEISTGTQKWIGQVKEITWRATLLQAFTDEYMTIPNRIMTQSQIANFNTQKGPILRSQSFRIEYNVDVEKVKAVLIKSVEEIDGVRQYPAPTVLITEVADSWLNFKLLYHIDDYGKQYPIGDRVVTSVLKEFSRVGVITAIPKMEIRKSV